MEENEKVSAVAEQLSLEAAEKTERKGRVKKNDAEKLVDSETGIPIASGIHPTDQAQNNLAAFGQEMARGFAAAMREAGVGAPVNPRNVTYGTLTGRQLSVKEGDFIGYYPLRGGNGAAQGGWFKVSEADTCSSDMTCKAMTQEFRSYDEGQGILYHGIKFIMLQRHTAMSGLVQIRSVETARLELAKMRADAKTKAVAAIG